MRRRLIQVVGGVDHRGAEVSVLGSWISRFVFTWASGMVLVTAGVQSFIDAVTPDHLIRPAMTQKADASDHLSVELMGAPGRHRGRDAR